MPIVLLFIASTAKCYAQINSTTPDAVFGTVPGDSYNAFEMTTETDALLLANGIPVQVSVSNSTTPNPEFHFNYNNGQYVGSRAIFTSAVIGAAHLYADDVALTYDGTNLVAFITCRQDMGGGNTIIYIYRAVWFLNAFSVSNTPQQAGNRTEANPVDYFDRVRIAYLSDRASVDDGEAGKEVGVAYSNNGQIVLQSWKLLGGNITLFSSRNNLFDDGNYTGPDISIGADGDFAVSAIKSGSQIKVFVSNHNIYNVNSGWWAWWWAYSAPGRKIRVATISAAQKYDWVLCFDELDNSAGKSFVWAIGRSFMQGVPTAINTVNGLTEAANDFSSPYLVNSVSESQCNENPNYVYTGFPSAKYTSGNSFEVVWQQVACRCSAFDFCNINALTRRFGLTFDNVGDISIIAPVSGEMYISSSDHSIKNTVFPSLAPIFDECINFYSFGKMDDGNSTNGEICYKKSACNSVYLRPLAGTHNPGREPAIKTLTQGKLDDGIYVYPNPAANLINVSIKGFKGNTRAYFFNATGALVNTFNVAGKSFFSIDVSKQASGTYLLKVADEKGLAQTKKIMIAK